MEKGKNTYFVWIDKYCESINSNTLVGIAYEVAKAHMMRIRWFKRNTSYIQRIIVFIWIATICIAFWGLIAYLFNII